jgi:hypothetical protein
VLSLTKAVLQLQAPLITSKTSVSLQSGVHIPPFETYPILQAHPLLSALGNELAGQVVQVNDEAVNIWFKAVHTHWVCMALGADPVGHCLQTLSYRANPAKQLQLFPFQY